MSRTQHSPREHRQTSMDMHTEAPSDGLRTRAHRLRNSNVPEVQHRSLADRASPVPPQRRAFPRAGEARGVRPAEKEVSRITTKEIVIMFEVRTHAIICLTTSALLNTTDSERTVFKRLLPQFTAIIGDDASQIPEPAIVAITTRAPDARPAYIGDVHQLNSRSAGAALPPRQKSEHSGYPCHAPAWE
ncbi:unnamed protein product [Heligmosomoides polygyrus]|uniref:Transposase n=1 Tax=Heligmosomoides polygyrus TaxID=6339 RepID=A0A183G7N4_HELPZ|nr:unnamed protein product [Heligmosomoides polygyrus]